MFSKILLCLVGVVTLILMSRYLPTLLDYLASSPPRLTRRARILAEDRLRNFFGVVPERSPFNRKYLEDVLQILRQVQEIPPAQRLLEKAESAAQTGQLPPLLTPRTEEYQVVTEDIEDVMTAYADRFYSDPNT